MKRAMNAMAMLWAACLLQIIATNAHAADPATQPASIYDGFAFIQSDRTQDFLTERGMWVGTVDPKGVVNTHFWKSDLLKADARPAGVLNGKLFLEHSPKNFVIDLSNGDVQLISTLDAASTSLLLAADTSRRGNMRAVWKSSAGTTEVHLTIQEGAKPPVVVLEHVQFSISPGISIALARPPLLWLDDQHLMTFLDGEHNGERTGLPVKNYRVMVVDIKAAAAREIGRVDYGYPQFLPPRGDAGDLAILCEAWSSSNSTFVISRGAAINGLDELRVRPMHWGDFTLNGNLSPLENGAVSADGLELSGRKLAGRAIVTISPDGRRAIWRTQMNPGKSDGMTLFFCDSADGKVQRIASADYLQMPVWLTKEQMQKN